MLRISLVPTEGLFYFEVHQLDPSAPRDKAKMTRIYYDKSVTGVEGRFFKAEDAAKEVEAYLDKTYPNHWRRNVPRKQKINASP